MTKKGTSRRSTGRNRPPRNSLDESWLPIVEQVHRDLPNLRAQMIAAKHKKLGPRKRIRRA